MPRLLSLFTLLALIGCGDAGVANGDKNGESRTYEPVEVSVGDSQRIRMVCQALSNKQDQVNVLAGSSYLFTYSEKNCNEAELSQPKDITTRIQRSGDAYIFARTDGGLFAFSDFETNHTGVMADICANLNTLRNPMQTSSTGAIWFTANASSDFCKTDASHVCMLVEKGSYTEGNTYKIHTTEWIRFSVGAERRGFFTERMMSSTATCKDGNRVIRKAVLR